MPHIKKNKIIFFDFDGVLVDTFELNYRLREELEPGLDRETYMDYFKGNIYDIRVEVTPTAEILRRQSLDYETNLQKIGLKKGLAELLSSLSQTYKRLAIVSSSPTPIIRRYIVGKKIGDSIFYVLGGDVDRSKETKINKVLRETGLSPSAALMVTDTLGDIMEAKRAGVASIGVTWGFHGRTVLEHGAPKAIVGSTLELERAINAAFPD